MAFDNNGNRAIAATAYIYEPESTTPFDTFDDAAGAEPADFPIVADGNGRWPTVFLAFGTYKEIIKTSGGTTLSTADNIPNPAPTDPAAGVDADSLMTTGELFFKFKDGTRSGAVRANGRSIGNAVSSATERANDDTLPLFTELYNSLDNAAAPVSGGRGANAAADFAAGKRLTLPDLRGRGPIGLETMGSSNAGRLAGVPNYGPSDSDSGTKVAYVVGEHTHALTSAQLASHTHALTGITVGNAGAHTHTATTTTTGSAHGHTVNVTDPGHTHTSGATGFLMLGAGDQAATLAGIAGGAVISVDNTVATATTGVTAATTGSDGTHTHTISTTSDPGNHTHTLSGTVDANGSGTAHNIVQNSLLGTWYIKLALPLFISAHVLLGALQ